MWKQTWRKVKKLSWNTVYRMVFVVSLNFEKFFEMTVNGIDRWFIQLEKIFYYTNIFKSKCWKNHLFWIICQCLIFCKNKLQYFWVSFVFRFSFLNAFSQFLRAHGTQNGLDTLLSVLLGSQFAHHKHMIWSPSNIVIQICEIIRLGSTWAAQVSK